MSAKKYDECHYVKGDPPTSGRSKKEIRRKSQEIMPSSSLLASLPYALVYSIFTSTIDDPERPSFGGSVSAIPQLQTLASVSHEWNVYARNVAGELLLSKLSLSDLKIRCRKDLLELRRRVQLRRAFLRKLTVSDSNHFNSDHGVVLSEDQWRTVTSHMPVLEDLTLKQMTRAYPVRIATVVCAAKRHCPGLSTLILPTLRPTRSGRASERPEHTQLLIDAALSKHGASKALRTLQLPLSFTSMPSPHEAAMAYLRRICDVCPNLQTCNGYAMLVDNHERLSSGEQWLIDTVTWENFCRTCVHLTQFDWIVVPFTTSFFEVFGRYAKPKLERLVLSTSMDWDWDRYFLLLDSPRPMSGYGATACNAHAVFPACPALRELEVAVYLAGDATSEDEDGGMAGFAWDIHGDLPDQHVRVPDHAMLDQEIFGNDFIEQAVRHCKQLEKLTIWRVVEASNVHQTIMAFGDRAMRALATLPVLRWVELKSVNITGDGLFSLVACFAPSRESANVQREFVITAGDQKGTATEMACYEIVERFLARLVACEPGSLPCADRKVALRLHNARLVDPGREWSKTFLANVCSLAQMAKAKHPSINLRLLTSGFDRSGRTCSNLVEFGFSTKSVRVSEWWGWENEPQDTRIDDFIVCRGSLFGERPARAVHCDDDYDEEEYGDY